MMVPKMVLVICWRFFLSKGAWSLNFIFILSGLQTITSALSYAWYEKMFFVEFKNVPMQTLKTFIPLDLIWSFFFLEKIAYHYITPQYYYHFDVIFYSRVSFWNKVVTWHLYKITVDPHKHKKMSGYVNVYT